MDILLEPVSIWTVLIYIIFCAHLYELKWRRNLKFEYHLLGVLRCVSLNNRRISNIISFKHNFLVGLLAKTAEKTFFRIADVYFSLFGKWMADLCSAYQNTPTKYPGLKFCGFCYTLLSMLFYVPSNKWRRIFWILELRLNDIIVAGWKLLFEYIYLNSAKRSNGAMSSMQSFLFLSI